MKTVSILGLGIISFCLLDVSTALAEDPIVYARCERTTATYELTGDVSVAGNTRTVTRRMTGLDVYDVLPDVTNFHSGFSAPCDLVLQCEDGLEEIIYNCSANSTDDKACAALDPAVSFDGKTIAFSVFHGKIEHKKVGNVAASVLDPNADRASLGYHSLPNKKLKSEGAHLHFYNIETGQLNVLPYVKGIYDSGPAFLSPTRVAFTSTRDKHRSTKVWRTTSSKPGTRIWTMDLDGKNPDLASHHSLSQEQHPYLLKNGRLAYSSWQIFGGLPFRHTNGTAGGFTTITNLFHIYTQDPDGAGNFAFYGQHNGGGFKSSAGTAHDAAHFLTQTSDERVWFADYYRGNNNGLGLVVGVMPEPEGQEGINPHEATRMSDMYFPRDVVNFSTWTSNSDNMAQIMPSPALTHASYTDPLPFAGKVGHPAALSNNGLMVAWGKGPCSTVASSRAIFAELGRPAPPATDGSGNGVAMNLLTSLEMDTPGCDVGLYRATAIPSQHPNDLAMIVDSPDWHEIMGRAVVSYSAIHGVAEPVTIQRADLRASHVQLEAGTPFGLLGAASITDRETHPRGGIQFAGELQFNLQGTDTIDYTDEDLCGVRILGVMPNRLRPKTIYNQIYAINNVAGERVSILGEFPVLNTSANGTRVHDSSGHPDTSFLVRMPANTPYLMQSIDCQGRTLNTDQTWQHLRPGEVKTCGGCHVHSRPSRTTFEQTVAASPAYAIPHLGEGTVPLLAGKTSETTVRTRTVPGYGLQVDFNRDILPIFEQRCASCHSDAQPAAGLVLNRPGTESAKKTATPSTWWCLVADGSQACAAPGQQMITNAGPQDVSFRRPQLTRYIRAFNSRGSLLYWKAANVRTDNRTDAFDPTDINFGTAHPTTMTPDELGLLSRWIDLGSPGGLEELVDTQKPTLHLATSGSGGSLSELKVGTVDLGSGIDVNSLVVCVLQSNNQCANLAGPAKSHGVTTVSLGSVSDANVEILAQVKDLAGNMTEVRRTAQWFFNPS